MAGGMYRGRSGPSLGERAALSGVRAVDPADDPAAADHPAAKHPAAAPTPPPHATAPERPVGPSQGRHCWVRDAPGAPGTRPGLLVEWRQREDGWYGRVAHVVDGRHGPVLVEAWLPAAHLHQG